jgi:putative ABC transport system permease protein
MLKHNLLLLFRNARRFKTTFLINVIGLTAGLSCALLIYLWISDEMKFDRFHEKGPRIFQIMGLHQDGGNINTVSSTPGLLAPTLLRNVPDIEEAANATDWIDEMTIQHDKEFLKVRSHFVSNAYFKIFSYPLLHGNASNALPDKHSVAISESVARKLFKDIDLALGKPITLPSVNGEFRVTCVFKDIPKHSSNRFDAAFSFTYYEEDLVDFPDWDNHYATTYVLLNAEADLDQLNQRIRKFIPEEFERSTIEIFAYPHEDLYLKGNFENGVQTGGRIVYVRLFAVVGILIVLIACINFINLSTAHASRRLKEIGIKRTVGASRSSLVVQHLTESILTTAASMCISLLIVDVSLPYFNALTNKNMVLTFDWTLAGSIIGMTMLCGTVAGGYPAMYLSQFKPVSVLKGGLKASFSDLFARKGLVTIQFALSLIFIVAVIIVYKQMDYLQSRDIGFDRNNVLYFEQEGTVNTNRETFLEELRNTTGVVNAAASGFKLAGTSWTYAITWQGRTPDDRIRFQQVTASPGLIEMMNIKVLEGRTFSEAPSDTLKIIFNEAAIDAMRMKDPIGQIVENYVGEKLEIIGVVENFHFESLHHSIKPMFFISRPSWTWMIMAKLSPDNREQTIADISNLYKKFNPWYAFNYKFVEDDYKSQYTAETQISALAKGFAALAILISCLGLLGLTAYSAERRAKEMGIRKILGANAFSILYLLSTEFIQVIAVAIIVTLPLCYFLASSWLASFAFSISLQWWYFLIGALAACVIAACTIVSQAIKTVRINPVQCLKDE